MNPRGIRVFIMIAEGIDSTYGFVDLKVQSHSIVFWVREFNIDSIKGEIHRIHVTKHFSLFLRKLHCFEHEDFFEKRISVYPGSDSRSEISFISFM